MTSGSNHVASPRFWRGRGSIALTWGRYSEGEAGFTGWLFVRIRQGGAWSTQVRFSRLSGYAEPAQAAYAPDGRLTLIWMYQSQSNYAAPSIEVDPAGATHAVWISQFRAWVADQVAPTG